MLNDSDWTSASFRRNHLNHFHDAVFIFTKFQSASYFLVRKQKNEFTFSQTDAFVLAKELIQLCKYRKLGEIDSAFKASSGDVTGFFFSPTSTFVRA